MVPPPADPTLPQKVVVRSGGRAAVDVQKNNNGHQRPAQEMFFLCLTGVAFSCFVYHFLFQGESKLWRARACGYVFLCIYIYIYIYIYTEDYIYTEESVWSS